MKCRLCTQKYNKLADSHILPKGFFRYLYPPDDNRALLSLNGKSRPKRIPVGYYDNQILCIDCDNKLGKYDEYGIKIFLNDAIIPFPNSNEAYLIKNINYTKLKIFLLSVLYRASITSIQEFKSIDLDGYYEEKIRNMISNEDTGDFNDFPFFITKFETNQLPQDFANKIIMNPYRTKIDKINFSIFSFPNGYTVYIKVDKKPLNSLFSKLSMAGDGDLIIMRRSNYESSKEFDSLCNVVKNLNFF